MHNFPQPAYFHAFPTKHNITNQEPVPTYKHTSSVKAKKNDLCLLVDLNGRELFDKFVPVFAEPHRESRRNHFLQIGRYEFPNLLFDEAGLVEMAQLVLGKDVPAAHRRIGQVLQRNWFSFGRSYKSRHGRGLQGFALSFGTKAGLIFPTIRLPQVREKLVARKQLVKGK